MTRYATRCGEPAHVNPPEPVKASVTMRDWLDRETPDYDARKDFRRTVLALLAAGVVLLAFAILTPTEHPKETPHADLSSGN